MHVKEKNMQRKPTRSILFTKMLVGFIVAACFSISYYATLNEKVVDKSPAMMATQSSSSSALSIPPKLESGWDEKGRNFYEASVLKLSTIGAKNVTIYNRGNVFVSNDEGDFAQFWRMAAHGGWERRTFEIFKKYITSDTTVVDFGTWIGPTLLYHGQYSKRSLGIEADPVAYSVAEYNVDLNKKLNPEWGRRVSVESACVSRPEDVGILTMRAGGRKGGGGAGQSMSGISEKVSQDLGDKAASWQVQCYTLPDIFDFWGLDKPYKDVFIKIDIESYECKLIPSFYDWLKDETFLPKMFLNYHSQSIDDCTDEEWKGLLKVLKLYDHVTINGDRTVLELDKKTTFKEFIEKVGKHNPDFVIYQNHHAKALNLRN